MAFYSDNRRPGRIDTPAARHRAIRGIVGVLMIFSSVLMLPPMLVALYYADGTAHAFLVSAAVLITLGVIAWWPSRGASTDLRLRDGFTVVVLSWLTVGLCGALPFLIADNPSVSLIEALFESMSGLTTTGATTLTAIDGLPRGILYFRQQLQWMGGMGIIVLAVAILPILRIGGMQMFRAETPGPMKDSKLTPRITETAKALWLIYLSLTIVCALAYWLAGMSLFDAVGHAYSTVAIGGFSTHDLSIAWFDSSLIESIAIVFMFISGMNFAMHFLAWRNATMAPYYNDAEIRVYAGFLLIAGLTVSLLLFGSQTYTSLGESVRYGLFQAVSAMTTTGYTTASFYAWPGVIPVLLVIAAFVGGCAGSTAGGMKVIRVVLLYRQAAREIRRLIHPAAVVPIKLNGKSMPNNVMNAVWGFFFLFIFSFVLMSLLVAATGVDLITAFSAVGACITNLGPALGEAGPHYDRINPAAKLILTFAMLLGRLEVFTLLVMFSPSFWKD